MESLFESLETPRVYCLDNLLRKQKAQGSSDQDRLVARGATHLRPRPVRSKSCRLATARGLQAVAARDPLVSESSRARSLCDQFLICNGEAVCKRQGCTKTKEKREETDITGYTLGPIGPCMRSLSIIHVHRSPCSPSLAHQAFFVTLPPHGPVAEWYTLDT